ncbi:MAG TPA: hypothetical protein VNH46_00470, partial [Gemmatimonadales bacterium]|nr:hypothetical protein [Gemmatimonadales bacterium]
GQLNTVDAQLAKSGGAPEGLEDLKVAVDSLRTSVWAVLSASRTSNYDAFISRFRLRRGIDTLRSIMAGLEGGGQVHPEHSELQILMQQLHEKIGRLRQGR